MLLYLSVRGHASNKFGPAPPSGPSVVSSELFGASCDLEVTMAMGVIPHIMPLAKNDALLEKSRVVYSLPEFLDFKLFGRTVLVVNKQLELFLVGCVRLLRVVKVRVSGLILLEPTRG